MCLAHLLKPLSQAIIIECNGGGTVVVDDGHRDAFGEAWPCVLLYLTKCLEKRL